MSQPSHLSNRLQLCLDRLKAGDERARDELLQGVSERLKRLTRKMLSDFPRVHRWEETDDVFQNSLIRLWRALEQVRPPTVADFVRLAATQIRRELVDLARHYFGPQGIGLNHDSRAELTGSALRIGPPDEPQDRTQDQEQLAKWTAFHEAVQNLPDPARDVFDLLWYQGLAHREAADILGVSERTIQRHWQHARLQLHSALGDSPPRPLQ